MRLLNATTNSGQHHPRLSCLPFHRYTLSGQPVRQGTAGTGRREHVSVQDPIIFTLAPGRGGHESWVTFAVQPGANLLRKAIAGWVHQARIFRCSRPQVQKRRIAAHPIHLAFPRYAVARSSGHQVIKACIGEKAVTPVSGSNRRNAWRSAKRKPQPVPLAKKWP